MTQTPREFDATEPASAPEPRRARTSGYAGDAYTEAGYAGRRPAAGTESDQPAGTGALQANGTAAADGAAGTSGTDPSGAASGVEPRKVTRAGMVWAAVASALVVLILLIAFILQNQDYVQVKFFGLEGAVALGIALFIAAVGGGVLVAIAGAARIIQLRVAAHRQRVRITAGR